MSLVAFIRRAHKTTNIVFDLKKLTKFEGHCVNTQWPFLI